MFNKFFFIIFIYILKKKYENNLHIQSIINYINQNFKILK